jgi:GNAT superfamily N-acetyltransferase
MSDLVIRPLTAGETHLFTSLPDPGVVGRSLLGQVYAMTDEGGEYRPEWTWVALREDRVVARAAWWGRPEDETPVALDWFNFTDPVAAARLLEASPLYAQYDLHLPPDWRGRPEVSAAVRARTELVQAAGMHKLVERLRYTWTTECGVPRRPQRLRFQAEPRDEAILAVLREITHGSLDAHTRRVLEESGAGAAALDGFDFLRSLPSPREWWKLAYTPTGDLVGIQVPASGGDGPCVGFIGVLPDQRGHGYAYDLLAECTHDLVATGAQRIVAATDQANLPMAAHFATAGYPITQETITFV